jgi:uncharacterized protein (DUF1330 family)
MKAYVIVDVTVNDSIEYEEYKKLTPETIRQYGGKFLVRGGMTETVEGDWKPGRVVILEFSSMERAREWWSSELYTQAKTIRQRAAYTQMIFVEGIPE